MSAILKKYFVRAGWFSIVILFAFSIYLSNASANSPYQYHYGIPQHSGGTILFNTTQQQFQNQYQYQLFQIEQLLFLIEQLKAQIANQGGSYYGVAYSNNSLIDITTRTADTIDDEEARLRGEVDFNDSRYAYLWFEYGTKNTNLDEDTPHIRRDDDESEEFSVIITDLDRDETYYFRAVGEDEDGRIAKGSIKSFETDRNGSDHSDDDEPDPQTESAQDVNSNSAELQGEVDMNDFENGIVFFVYGLDEDQIKDVEDEYDSYDDIDEDGDDLQKIKVDSDLDGDESYERTVSGLEDDETYFYSICVEYEDEDDDETVRCGSVEEFETGNGQSSDDEPRVITGNATDVTDDSADFDGEVDMNDFNNGLVFFVFGEDEDQVDDVDTEYDSYDDIDEDGDDLQKIKVDSDLDGDATYDANVYGLDSDTEHYYRICVEYEDDGDEQLVCGSTRSFTTDD